MRPSVILGIGSLVLGLVAWRASRWIRAAGQSGDPAEALDLLETNRKFYDELWSERGW